MTSSLKSILVICITAILHGHAFSQETSNALNLLNTGLSFKSKDPIKAFQSLKEAIHVSKKNKEWEVYLKAVNALVEVQGVDGKEEEVFGVLIEAVDILKDSKETIDLALLHYRVGQFYNNLTSEIDLPISHFETAKKIWTSIHGEWHENVADCYHSLGDVYKYSKFDFQSAEKSYEMALLIREKINFQDMGVLYRNFYSLAATNGSQRDFEKALSYGMKTLEVAKKLEPLRLEMSNGMIANIYRDMREFELAKKYYLTALALNTKTKNLETRAWYYLCLGETYKNDSSLTDALRYFKKAYALYTTPEVNDPSLFINLLINLLDTYSVMSNLNGNGSTYENFFFKTANEVLNELNKHDMHHSREATQVWLITGDYYQRKANNDSAIFYYQKALTTSVPSFQPKHFSDNPSEEMIGYRYYINEILSKKALALKARFLETRKIQFLEQSLACLVLAEKLLSEQRNILDMEDAKWQFLDQNYDLYENILQTLFEGINYLNEDSINSLALKYFGRSKARTLSDALAQTERTTQINTEDSLLRLHTRLKRELFSKQDEINKVLDKRNFSGNVLSLREDIVELDQQIQICKRAIEEKYPGYFNAKYGHKSISLSAIRKVLKSKNQTLLEYFWGNNFVYGIGINHNGIVFKRIGAQDSIKATVNKLLDYFADGRSSTNPQVFKSFTVNAYALYTALVNPFKSITLNSERIQVIPDGAISQIPFEVLLEENYPSEQVNYRALKYLIKSFTIGYAYSSAILFQNKVPRKSSTPSLLAIGFTEAQSIGNLTLQEIRGAEEELKTLEQHFHAGRFMIGEEATESNFKSMAPEFDIIHLAIHGMGDVEKNFAASLFFTPKYDSLDDGELHAYELYGLKLKAFMAVLSSCESGLGRGYKGEGMISMASAFTYSGCENILMSLWKVNDQTSTSLMDDFYRNLLEGKSISESLRMSKINYLRKADELTADPKIWAPLVAYGNLDQLIEKNSSRMYLIVGLSALFAILLLFFVRKIKFS